MTEGNHWTVFNGGGAVVADNLTIDGVMAYMTNERFDRRWHACYCVLVKNMGELLDLARPVAWMNEAGDISKTREIGYDWPLYAGDAMDTDQTVYEKSARWAWPDGRPDL
jgi:hypothetical protein